MLKNASDYGPNTHRRFIAEMCEQGKSQSDAYRALEPLVIAGMEPMIFHRNPRKEIGETHRVALPMAEQLIRLREAIGRIYSEMGRTESGQISTIRPTIQPETEITETEIRPTAGGKNRRESELEKYIAALTRTHEVLTVRAMADESKTPSIANRQFEAGGNLIIRGFTSDALLHTMSLTWGQDLKAECGIPQTYDYLKLSADLAEEFDVVAEWNRVGDRGRDGTLKPIHPMLGIVRALADARQPIYLYGNHGTGKSYLARQLATLMGLDYGETPMSLGATRGDLLGRYTASAEKAFIAARFPKLYQSGGVFNFEEFDATDPRMAIVLNNALAGNQFHNSMNDDQLDRSDDFIAIATANTLAQGATAKYMREKLDAATLDRWNMGRVKVDFDLAIATYLARNPTRPYNPARQS